MDCNLYVYFYNFIIVAQPRCSSRADVGFLIDSSTSVLRDFSKEKEFVSRIAKLLKISPNGNHAGAVIFSSSPELRIRLSDHTDVHSFSEAVENLPLLGGRTRIDRALEKAYDELFSVENGMRQGVSKLLIVLTDGKQTKDDTFVPLSDAILPFHEAGIKVIVIGIGSLVDKFELSKLVTEPSDLFLAKDFEELVSQNFISNITLDSCNTPGLFSRVVLYCAHATISSV